MITESLLAAVTEAVFSYPLEQTGLTEKIRARLGRDPQRLAFQVALTRAYATFARHYPQWTASFFDEHFLTHQAAPILARCLIRDLPPNPAQLAAAWADQLELEGKTWQQCIANLMPIAADFLRWLEAELRDRPECQSLFDSRALDTIAEATAQTAQVVEALRTELKQTLAEAGKYHVIVEEARGPVIGDHNIIFQQFTTGVTRLPTDYAARIQNFLTEYLGTPDRPVPFGGRQAALADLDAWLADPAAPPYLLLAAPAGRGKSALLVRWSQTLLTRDDLAVVFIPVSVRFRTNLASVVFAALVARLAVLHEDEVPGSGDTSVEVWRGMASDYMARPLPDGRRLLVILDGVDEAADWEAGPDLFPLTPPPGLRMILSARYLADVPDADAWLARLGWAQSDQARAPNLPPLDKAGVADVLRRMSFPLEELGAQVDVVAELHRLSQGDPLLVRLYVDNLWEQKEATTRLKPEDLGQIEPGLKGYFGHWWCDQRALWGKRAPLWEPAVQTVLNLLACAFGPLTQSDLLALAPPEVGLNTWTLEEALEPLARFVVDNAHKQGYAFSHPRLGAYFYERLTPAERESWETRFLDWGRATLAALKEGRLEPNKAPAYLVQYYRAHMERTGASPEALLALVSDGWRRAWEALEGAYSGFLTDVERAWRAAEEADAEAAQAGKLAPYLGAEVRCALYRASVNSLAKNIPSELLSALVENRVWTPAQGLAYAKQAPDSWQQAEALAELIPHLPETLLGEALAAARALKEWHQEKALVGLASRLAELDHFQEALEVVWAIGTGWSRTRALVGLAPYLPQPWLREALAAVQGIKDEKDRAWALGELAPRLPEALLREALAAARAFEGWHQAEALAGVAPCLPEPLRSETLREALVAARAIEVEWWRAEAMVGLGSRLLETEGVEILREALIAARAIRDEQLRAKTLVKLALQLPEADRAEILQEALVAAQAIENETHRNIVLAELVPWLADLGLWEALAVAEAIRSGSRRAEALAGLAHRLAELGHFQKALAVARAINWEQARSEALVKLAINLPEALLLEALDEARAIENQRERAKTLAGLVPHLPNGEQVEVLQEALMAVRAIGDEYGQARALAGLIPRLAELGCFQGALTAARAIEDEMGRAEALVGLGLGLPETERAEVLQEALAATRTIKDKEWRAENLIRLAPQLPEAECAEVLREALAAAQVIKSKKWRAENLARLAPQLPEVECTEALREALAAAQAIENEETRTEALAELALRLAELDYFKEALTAAQALPMIEWYSWHSPRAETLAKLAPHLPEAKRAQVLRQALAVVHAIERIEQRAHALVGLVPHLPETERAEVLRKALTTVWAMAGERNRVTVLAELAPHLPASEQERVLQEALAAARAVEDVESRAWALAELAPRLAELGQPEDALAAAREIGWESVRAKALAGLIPYLPEALLGEAQATTREVKSEWHRAEALAELAFRLAKLGYQKEALAAAREIRKESIRAQALAGLVPHLPEAKRARVLRGALAAAWALSGIDVWWHSPRAEALATLATHLAELPRSAVYPLWRETLPVLAGHTRPDLLADLCAFAPVIACLGGAEAVAETFHAIYEVGRRWP